MSISPRCLSNSKRRHDSGFTILEILIAISILTVGMLAAAQMQIMAIEGNDLSGSTTVALNLAQQQLERLIHMDYNDEELRDVDAGNNTDLTSITTTDHEQDSGRYRIIWNVADNEPIADTKTIVVIVTWDNGRYRRILAHIKSLTA